MSALPAACRVLYLAAIFALNVTHSVVALAAVRKQEINIEDARFVYARRNNVAVAPSTK